MNKETGGSAFPTNNWQKMVPLASGYHEGMTLRDYFAAHADDEDVCVALDQVQKVERMRDLGNGCKVVERVYPDNARQLARYIHADAMLKAREQ